MMYIYYVLRGTQAGKRVELDGGIDEENFPSIDLSDGRAILTYLEKQINSDSRTAGNWEAADLTDSFFDRDDNYINFNGRWMRRSDAPWRKDKDN